MKRPLLGIVMYVLFFVIIIITGEVKCIIKMCSCNWEPIGKAEIFYTVGTFTGLGVIVGYINIDDN